MWIDLTKAISHGLSGYTDDPKTTLIQKRTVKDDGYSLYELSMGMHTGTHLDSPRHMLEEGDMIDQIPIEQLIGSAVLIDAREDQLVTAQHRDVGLINKGDIVLVYGGESKTIIDESFARVLVRKQIKMLGIDFDSPDAHPFVVHKLLFARDILILEHLCNLEQLLDKKQIEIVVAPLKMHTDGAVARVYAKVEANAI